MTPQFAPSRRGQVPPFQAMAITDRVAQLRAEGRDVLSLAVGEPRGGAPSSVADAARIALDEREGLGYTSPLGTADLRRAIAAHYRRWYGMEVAPRNVAVTTGSSGAFVLVFLAAFDPGARVAIARPGYPAYRHVLRALGCEVVELDADLRSGFQPTPALLDAAVADGPIDGLVIASPANPTGSMLSRDALAKLADWCERHGTRLISDEIYHGLTYGAGHELGPRGTSLWEFDGSLAGAGEENAAGEDDDAERLPNGRTGVVVSSFSKYWGMTGWRLGWALVPDDLLASVDALAGNVALAPPTPAQRAALDAFGDEAYAQADARVADMARARLTLLAGIGDLDWGSLAPSDGAFYVWADISPQFARLGVADSTEYCRALLEEGGVALTPGADFDEVNGGAYLRVSFGGGADAVLEALERIRTWQDARGQRGARGVGREAESRRARARG